MTEDARAALFMLGEIYRQARFFWPLQATHAPQHPPPVLSLLLFSFFPLRGLTSPPSPPQPLAAGDPSGRSDPCDPVIVDISVLRTESVHSLMNVFTGSTEGEGWCVTKKGEREAVVEKIALYEQEVNAEKSRLLGFWRARQSSKTLLRRGSRGPVVALREAQ